jgi:hypothetical protein
VFRRQSISKRSRYPKFRKEGMYLKDPKERMHPIILSAQIKRGDEEDA